MKGGPSKQLMEPQRRGLGKEEQEEEEMSCTRPSWARAGGGAINNSAPEIMFLALINQEPLQPSLPSLLTSRP